MMLFLLMLLMSCILSLMFFSMLCTDCMLSSKLTMRSMLCSKLFECCLLCITSWLTFWSIMSTFWLSTSYSYEQSCSLVWTSSNFILLTNLSLFMFNSLSIKLPCVKSISYSSIFSSEFMIEFKLYWLSLFDFLLPLLLLFNSIILSIFFSSMKSSW